MQLETTTQETTAATHFVFQRNGNSPVPILLPFHFTDAGEAAQVASDLAEQNPGREFDVMSLLCSFKEAPDVIRDTFWMDGPVIEHEAA